MKRASLALCACGGFLLLVVGCNGLNLGFDLTGPSIDPTGEVCFIDAEPAVAGVILRDKLNRMGFEAKVLPNNEFVQCKTPAGLVFSLALKSERGGDGRERTHVSIVWNDNRTDQQLFIQLCTEFNVPSAQKK